MLMFGPLLLFLLRLGRNYNGGFYVLLISLWTTLTAEGIPFPGTLRAHIREVVLCTLRQRIIIFGSGIHSLIWLGALVEVVS